MIDDLCRKIIEELDIHLFVETGTDLGETIAEIAKWFADMDPEFGKIRDSLITGAGAYYLGSEPIKYPVFEDVGDSKLKIFSVDVDNYSFENARRLFKTNSNINLSRASSPDFLRDFIDRGVFKSSETIFFLDAHWGKYWPLRDEIAQILRLERSMIVIHDFFVPGLSKSALPHGNFGFDFYRDTILCWAYVYDLFKEADVKTYYPKLPGKDRRGFIALFTGYSHEELSFLKELPLEYVDRDDPVHTNPVPFSLRAYFDFRHLLRTFIPLSLLRSGARMFQRLTHR